MNIWILEENSDTYQAHIEALKREYGKKSILVFETIVSFSEAWFDTENERPRPDVIILPLHTHTPAFGKLLEDSAEEISHGTRTGVILAKKIRALDPTVPIVIYSFFKQGRAKKKIKRIPRTTFVRRTRKSQPHTVLAEVLRLAPQSQP